MVFGKHITDDFWHKHPSLKKYKKLKTKDIDTEAESNDMSNPKGNYEME